MISKVKDKLQSLVSRIVNNCFEAILRKRLHNHDFSILCSNCAGGVISHRLGQEFRSPTVNLWMHQRDFLKLAENLRLYMSYELEFIQSEYNYPVAKLHDITIYFNHAKCTSDAADSWNRRKTRINYDNLFLLMYDREDMTVEDLRRIENVPCRGKVIFSDKKRPELDYVFTMRVNDRPMGMQCMDKDWFGLRTFEKRFDFVKWLNQKPNKG